MEAIRCLIKKKSLNPDVADLLFLGSVTSLCEVSPGDVKADIQV